MGESCIVVEFGTSIDPEVNERVHRLARILWEARSVQNVHVGEGTELAGVQELVPTYRSLAVYFDPLKVQRKTLEERITTLIHELVREIEGAETEKTRKDTCGILPPQDTQGPLRYYNSRAVPSRKKVIIPVCYGGEYGPDLEFVSQYTGLSEEEVVKIHTACTYRVYMLGFLPGFPYLGGMDERIAAPRLETPRTRIPAGSVGIAGSQTGFYPMESPGGWRIIGRTPIKAFDPFSDNPFLLAPGDLVQFRAIGQEEYQKIEESGGRL